MFPLLVLVRRKGLEPPTYCVVVSHSIQLSYWRIRTHLITCLSIIAHHFKKCKHFFSFFCFLSILGSEMVLDRILLLIVE